MSIDANGLVVQDSGDGGDTPCRTGLVIAYWAANSHAPSQNNFINSTQKWLRVKPNVYVRYPFNPSYDISSDFSRDQASRLMLGYGIAGRVDLVKGYYKLLLQNDCKHPNGDLIGSGEPILLIRALSLWYLWPLLWIMDIKFLYDVLFGIKSATDYANLFIGDLWFAKNKYWTVWAWLAAKLCNKTLALSQLQANLANGNPATSCKEAYIANVWFLNNL